MHPSPPGNPFDAIEAERRRLDALLQREVIDSLTLLLAQVHVYEQSMAANPTARLAMSVVAALAQQALQQARDLSNRLAPAALETLGLEAAIEYQAAQLARTSGVRIAVTMPHLPQRPPQSIELLLLRIAQAALERATREAGAQHVQIRLEQYKQFLHLSVSDDGRPDAGQAILEQIRREAAYAGGSLRIETTIHGVQILVQVAYTNAGILTEREQQVLALLTRGLSNKAIAESLAVTPRTVNFHLNNIYAKLHVRSRTEAIAAILGQDPVRIDR